MDGVWRSPVACLLWEQEVPGSNPGAPICRIQVDEEGGVVESRRVVIEFRRRSTRLAAGTLGLGLLMALASCQSLGLAPPIPEREIAIGGDYRGYLWVEGQPVPGTLVLTGGGRAVEARLASEAGVSGSGGGQLAGNSLLVEIAYRTSCPGELILDGSVTEDGGRFEGSFTARDCTGSSSGRFDFRRP
jgi:hypothetical protein